jgi:HD-GYP domain-containing protein (c-di-GMP phosphodiesterase class II)
MTTDRVYRKALTGEAVRAELLRERGRQWHASVVDAFLEMIDERGRLAEARA